ANLTIRGHQGFAARDLPQVVLADAVTFDQPGWTLQNLNILNSGGTMTISANVSLLSSSITYVGPGSGDVIDLKGTTAAVLRNNTIVRDTADAEVAATVVSVITAAGAQNIIAANTISSTSAVTLLRYTGDNTITDRVEDNTFLGNEPLA